MTRCSLRIYVHVGPCYVSVGLNVCYGFYMCIYDSALVTAITRVSQYCHLPTG